MRNILLLFGISPTRRCTRFCFCVHELQKADFAAAFEHLWLAAMMQIFDRALLFLKGPSMLGTARGKALKAILKGLKAR